MTSTSETTDTGYKTLMYPVTITAGVDKLSAAPGATVTTGGSNTAAQTTASNTASKTGAAASTSTNAGPVVTQNAVLAGVAAVVGGVLAL